MATFNKLAIILAAEQNVGRGAELDTIADVRLNLIINTLYQSFTWPTMKKISASITLTTSSNSWTVPTDYNHADIMTYVYNNNTLELPIIPFEDLQVLGTSQVTTGTPQFVSILKTIDDAGIISLSGYVFPKPNINYTATLVYYRTPIFDGADASDPVNLNVGILVDLLTNELIRMGYDRIGKIPYDPALLEKVVGRMRRNLSDMGIYPERARLDQRVFKYHRTFNRGRFPQDTGSL